MGVRKNQNKLSDAEKKRFTDAVVKMKADAAATYNYDQFVRIHNDTSPPGVPTIANPAHRGPAFFPWHRYFLLKFENALKDADRALGGDGSLTLPYWDWTHDNSGDPGSQRGSLWKDNFLGGFGTPVTDGPFRQGQWTEVLTSPPGRALSRNLGRAPALASSLPEDSHVKRGLALEGFDTAPWFDNSAEGPSLASPRPPALTGASGGGLAPGRYRVSLSYVNVRGETRASSETTICLGGACSPANAHNAIRVASPPAEPSATAFRIYVTDVNGAASTGTLQGGDRPLGASVTIGAVVAGTARPSTNTTGSMRNFMEGWISTRSPVESEMHNRVHLFVGGSMMPPTSPNDPVFFLHHCNVDRLWALWQFAHPGQNYPEVVPPVGAVVRPHGFNDPMPPWTVPAETKRPIDVLNHTALGYTYDTDPAGASVNVNP